MNTNVLNQRATELFGRHIKFSQNEASWGNDSWKKYLSLNNLLICDLISILPRTSLEMLKIASYRM